MTKQELDQVSRAADLTPDKVWITLQNLQKYKTKSDEKLDAKLKTTQFQASQIVEANDKKFVSQTEKDKITNTYTKAEVYNKGEIDNKFTDKIAGLAFKGTFETPDALPKEGCKDGWLAIVINDPKTQGKNVLYIYETAELLKAKGVDLREGPTAAVGKWIKLSDLMVPGLATETTDGLMSKDDKKKLNGIDAVINAAKQEVTQKVTALEQKHNQEKAALEAKIGTDIAASEKKITAAYTQADTALEGKITQAYKAADQAITQQHATDKQALENKIQAVDAKFVAATDVQIEALFA